MRHVTPATVALALLLFLCSMVAPLTAHALAHPTPSTGASIAQPGDCNDANYTPACNGLITICVAHEETGAVYPAPCDYQAPGAVILAAHFGAPGLRWTPQAGAWDSADGAAQQYDGPGCLSDAAGWRRCGW